MTAEDASRLSIFPDGGGVPDGYIDHAQSVHAGEGNEAGGGALGHLDVWSTLTAKVNYQIELDWDCAFLIVSTDGGASWTAVAADHSTASDPNGQNFGNGITGSSPG
jgi:immune inhibitor A